MNSNYILLIESEFDPAIFKKYFKDQDINSPGVYAIPDESPEMEKQSDSGNDIVDFLNNSDIANSDNESRVNIGKQNKEIINQQLVSTPPIPQQELTPEEQQRYEFEIIPLKKAYILQKLSHLSLILRKNFSSDNDLDLLIRYGAFLSYKTLRNLAINVLNHLKEKAAQEKTNNNEPENNKVNNEKTIDDIMPVQ